ncbi:MAG: cyclic nucleotide-binding serine/threonine-protein kinase [Candidatus Gracilibacteria bacterium]
MSDFSPFIDEIFAGIALEERERFLKGEEVWNRKTIPEGEMIFEEGVKSTDLYLILKGRVEISKQIGDDQSHKKILAVLVPGSLFGEGALLSDKPRSAAAKALEEVEALILTRVSFYDFLKKSPEKAMALLVGLLKVLNQRLQTTNQELVTLYEIAQLVSHYRQDIPGLIREIGLKMENMAQAERGIIVLKNKATGKLEIPASWGEFLLSEQELGAAERELGKERGVLKGGRLILAIQNIAGKELGFMVMEQEEWTIEEQKIARAIADQLGIAIADYEFMASEEDRSRLKREKIQF